MNGTSDELLDKTEVARRQAYDEELTRLEKETTFQGRDALRRWLEEEGMRERASLGQAEQERESQVKTLMNREQELIRQLEEEERRKRDDVRRRKEDEERRKRDEDARQQKKVEEEKRIREKEAQASSGLTREELERVTKSREHLTNAEALLQKKNYEDALVEVSKALGLVPVFPDAVGLMEKIRLAQRTAREEEQKAAAGATVETAEKAPRRKVSMQLAAVCIVVLLAAAIVFGVLHNRRKLFPGTVPVAVLPLTGDTSDPLLSALSTAIPDQIICRLQCTEHMRIMGTGTALAIQRQAADPLKAATALGFINIVTGTVATVNGRAAVTLTLVDSSGANQWSRTYQNIDADDGRALDRMASDILHEIHPEEIQRLGQPKIQFQTATAFQSFLHGISHIVRGDTPDDIAALDAFREGLKIDSLSRPLLLGEARAAICLARISGQRSQYLPVADDLTSKVFALGSPDAECLEVRGMLHSTKREYVPAQVDFDDALQMLPGSSALYYEKGRVELESGKYDDAAKHLARAIDSDPRNPVLLEYSGYIFHLKGWSHDAVAAFEAAMQNGRDSIVMLTGPIADAILYDPELVPQYIRRVNDAFGLLRARNPGDFESIYRFARFQQVLGYGIEWNTLFNRVKDSIALRVHAFPQDGVSAMLLARTLTRLGKYPEASRLAQQAIAADAENPDILYRAAEIYSIQMFSVKTNLIDSVKKNIALRSLRSAASLDFRPEEIMNGDFYNFRGDADFKKAIQLQTR